MTFEQQRALQEVTRRNIFVLANAAADFADEIINALAKAEPARQLAPLEQPKQSQDSFLTRKQVAELLNVSVRTVDNMRSDGLPVAKIRGRSVRFDRKDVLEWPAARNVKSRAKSSHDCDNVVSLTVHDRQRKTKVTR